MNNNLQLKNIEELNKNFSSFVIPTITKDISDLIGPTRILIEMEGKPEQEILIMFQKYLGLLNSIVSILENELKNLKGKVKEEAFIIGVWGIMYGNLGIKYGENEFRFLYESLQTNEFYCQTSSLLVYDIAKKLGIEVYIVSVMDHVLIKTNNFYFETTDGTYTDETNYLNYEYGEYFMILEDNQIQSITYDNKGTANAVLEKYEEAIENYDKAIELNPKDAGVYNNRGVAKAILKRYIEAIKDFDKAIELNPNYASVYNNRGAAKAKLEKYKEAIKDFDKAIELDSTYESAHYNRKIAKIELEK
ncbi:MAG: tetratricopeptide repeat protein [Candidatus Micrarchaeia archaeon]|jgi:tetratricopeptide (TPR) repeat protein